MSDRTIYVEQSSYDDFAMFRVDVERFANDRVTYTIGPSHLDKHWTESAVNKTDIKMSDYGDGVRLVIEASPEDPNRHIIELDYSQLGELAILLDAYARNQNHRTWLTRFKQVEDEDR